MSVMKPFEPINLCIISTHLENPSKKYRVYLELVLEQGMNGIDEKLVSIPIRWARFNHEDPQSLQTIKTFNFVLSNVNGVGEIPTSEVDPKDGSIT